MADFVFNVGKGRVVELVNRVNLNDPANSALVVVVLALAGIETDAVLKDKTTLADLVSGATDEATNVGYARKTVTDSGLIVATVDQANDRTDVTQPNLTWTSVAAFPGAWAKLVVCYDSDTTAGTDANIIPLTAHDFAITPDGSDVIAQIGASGFFRAA